MMNIFATEITNPPSFLPTNLKDRELPINRISINCYLPLASSVCGRSKFYMYTSPRISRDGSQPSLVFSSDPIQNPVGEKTESQTFLFWLVVSTHLKNVSQVGSFPQVGVKIKNV